MDVGRRNVRLEDDLSSYLKKSHRLAIVARSFGEEEEKRLDAKCIVNNVPDKMIFSRSR